MPAGVAAADRRLGRAGPGRGRSCIDARRMAQAHRQIQRGAEEPAAQPGSSWRASATRTRTRSCGRRDCSVPQARPRSRPTRWTRCTTRRASVLRWAIDELHERVPPRLEVEQRDFLKVHRKGGEACPRCGTRYRRSRRAVSTRPSAAAASARQSKKSRAARGRAALRRESKRILATTYFPEELPPEYLRRWRA